MTVQGWQDKFEREMAQARSARAAGNEGQARVCARRAAGAVAGEYLRQKGIAFASPSAFDRLEFLSDQPDISPQVEQIVERLLMRVDTAYNLPPDIDLLADADELIRALGLTL